MEKKTYLRWINKVMNVKGIFVSYQFHERGFIKCNIFLSSKGNKINFTHISVDYMDKQQYRKLNKTYGSIIA